MRYFLTLAYRGTPFAGWQRQPNAASVQETLEKSLSILLREPVALTGCGRTDTGVHARYYVAHFDAEEALPATFLTSLNSLLPPDIAVYTATEVAPEAHARFDALSRSYTYRITFHKDPFGPDLAWHYPRASDLVIGRMQAVADLLMQYDAFFPFCKTNSSAEHYACQLTTARWEEGPASSQLNFHISANRFLRGMVRLIVGASVLVAKEQLSLEDIRTALDRQAALKKSLSAPPEGLFLTDVRYPEHIFSGAR